MAQNKDYKAYRDSIFNHYKGAADSNTAALLLSHFEHIDINKFDTNLHFYHRDLGFCSYKLYLFSNDSLHIRKAISHYLKTIDQTKEYWNLAVCYLISGECKNMKYYLGLHLNKVKTTPSDEAEIKNMILNCDKKRK